MAKAGKGNPMSGKLAFALAVLLAAGAAPAAQVPFEAALTVQIATLPPLVFTGTGLGTVNGSGGGAHLGALQVPAGVAGTAGYLVPVTDPAALPIMGVQLTAANGAGAFAPTGMGALGGSMPILGVTKVCLFAPCPGAPLANLSVPLTPIGSGGSQAVAAVVNLTVIGVPWTTGTASVGAITTMGFAHGPASLTSSTALSSGAVRMVTPIFVSTNISASAVIPAFAFFDVHFVPEPGVLLLVATGLAGLAIARRSQSR
jgi:hypothetical protein